MSTTETTEMTREIVIDSTTPGVRSYVEVGVPDGDDEAVVYCEDLDGGPVELRLSTDEIDALIDALQRARVVAEANADA